MFVKTAGFVESSVMHRASPSIPPPKLPVLLQCAFPTRLRLSVTLLPLLSLVRPHRRHAGRPVPRLITLIYNTSLDTRRRHGQRTSTRPRTSRKTPGIWRGYLGPTVSWESQPVPSTGICQRHELMFQMRRVVLVHRCLYPTHNALILLCDALGLRSNRGG